MVKDSVMGRIFLFLKQIMPFQAKWDNNRGIVKRDFENAKTFLLGSFEKSLKLRAEAYLHFRRYFYES